MQLTFYDHCKSKTLPVKKLNPVKLPFHELVIVFQGELQYKVNNQPVPLKAQDVMYIPQGAIRARKASPNAANYVSLHFLSSKPLPLPVKMEKMNTGNLPMLVACVDQIHEEFFLDSLPIMEKMIEGIARYLEAELSRRSESPLVKKIKQYMFSHIRDNVKIEDIATEVFFSPSYCNAVFKKETGLPIMSYFNNLRLQEAKMRLTMQDVTLREAAETVGFYDYNYFSRIFKKHFGVTPLQYRKEKLKFLT